jgi:hypothetical protein
MRRLIYILCAVVLVGRSNSLSLGEEISAAGLGERISATSRGIKNASFTVTYDDSIDGSPDQYSVVRIVYDSSGRVRRTELDKGSYDAEGNKVSSRKGRKDSSFDGEKSIVLNTYKDLDGSGKPIFAPEGVYRIAVITDATNGASMWRTKDRDPLRNNPVHLLVRLDALAAAGQAVELNPIQYEGEVAVVVRFQQGGVEVTATIDPKRSWALRDLVEKDSMGTTTKHYHVEYAQANDRFWLPLRGTTTSLREKVEPPVLLPPKVRGGKPELVPVPAGTGRIAKYHTAFELSNLVINDPNLDESVFTISLPDGTRVSDLR